MATEGYSQEDIEQVKAFCAVDTPRAIKLLKYAHGNLERAAEAHYDDVNLDDTGAGRWDEAAFEQDKAGNTIEGSQPGQNLITAAVEKLYREANRGHLAYGEFLQPNTAPSRPPSRVSHSSNTGSLQEIAPLGSESMSQEEWNIKRAIRESQGLDPGPEYPPATQQSGVIENSGHTYFGPATRSQYDAAQWSLTRTTTTGSTVEIVEHPENAFERKRDDGKLPALSPTGSEMNGFKPALLRILHEIPAARNALILPAYDPEDLGQLDKWYQGEPVSQVMVMQSAADIQQSDLDIVLEVQRLMAFLDQSDRAYARPKHLADVVATRTPDSEESKFLDPWLKIADLISSDPNRRKLFNTRVMYTTNGSTTDFENVLCHRIDLEGHVKSIYEHFNNILWPSNSRQGFVRQAGDIICINIHQQRRTTTEGLGIPIPPAIYLDRYLEENFEACKGMRADLDTHQAEVKKLGTILLALPNQPHPKHPGQTLAGVQLVQDSIDILKAEQERNAEREAEGEGCTKTDEAQTNAEKDQKMIKDLEKVLEDLKAQINTLQTKVQEHRDAIDEARQQFSQEDIGEPQHHRYVLRGLCIEGKKTFFQAASHLSKSEPGSTENSDQWWQQDFSFSSTTLNNNPSSIDEAIESAVDWGKDVLVVYANEKACSEPLIPLPRALQSFVDTDNAHFASELANAQSHATQSSFVNWDDTREPDSYARSHPRETYGEQEGVAYIEFGHRSPSPPIAEIESSAPRVSTMTRSEGEGTWENDEGDKDSLLGEVGDDDEGDTRMRDVS
ncbi:MAG: hypothetical protein M1820_009093 [Bogoriella megaspora]|nr:MAG: hypothetical protein M1820_009093 [Bogoriella megaspora]